MLSASLKSSSSGWGWSTSTFTCCTRCTKPGTSRPRNWASWTGCGSKRPPDASEISAFPTLGVDTTSLLAILSVAGLAVSLSLQTALSNVAGAMMILTAKPFRAGDYVQIGDKAGTVLTIGAVYTSLRTYDGQRIYLPNSQVTTAAIVNQTAEPARRIDLNVSASYDDAADTVRAVLTQAVAAHEKVLKDRPIEAHVTGYGDSAVNYVLRFWARTEDYWTCYNDVLDGLQAAFSSAGITMTYPHINVHMES